MKKSEMVNKIKKQIEETALELDAINAEMQVLQGRKIQVARAVKNLSEMLAEVEQSKW